MEEAKMKLISWNVNGLRACMNKGFLDFFKVTDADIFCVQETNFVEDFLRLLTNKRKGPPNPGVTLL